MSNEQQASDDIRRLAKMMRGLLAVADDLERVGSVKNAAAEAQVAYEAAVDKRSGAEAALNAVTHEVEKARTEAAETVKAAQDQAERIVATAHSRATEVNDRALADSKEMVRSASERAKQIESKVEEAQSKLSSTLAEIVDAEVKLRNLNEQIEAIRRQVRA